MEIEGYNYRSFDKRECGKARRPERITYDRLPILLLCTFIVGNGAPLFYTCNGPTPGNVPRIFVCNLILIFAIM